MPALSVNVHTVCNEIIVVCIIYGKSLAIATNILLLALDCVMQL